MNCKFCNAEIDENKGFCTSCGKELREEGNISAGDSTQLIDSNAVVQNQPKVICSVCGEALIDGQLFCTKCGTAVLQKRLCNNCGAELQPEQAFCPVCGTKIISLNKYKTNKQKKRRKIIPIVAVLIIAIAAIAIISVASLGKGTSGGNFLKMYSDIASEEWCEISPDGKWMELDTNPNDIDEDDFTTVYYLTTYTPCIEKIEEINSELGFPASTKKKMDTTTALQGRQSDETDKYKVTWSFHPDKGLLVLYEIK